MASKPIAAALVVLMCLGCSSVWHIESDDPDFLPLVGDDHSTHHEILRTAAPRESPTHCAICHWLQMFRAGAERQTPIRFARASSSAHAVTAIPPTRAGALLDVPARAPPA